MASKKVGVLPLTEEEYTAALKTFRNSTTQYQRQLEMMKPVFESFKSAAIDFLSIGAGTGCFENDLVINLRPNVSYFHAVEPNECHCEQLEQKVIAWGNKFTVDQSYFTENYEVEHKFDLVMMSHCLYSIDNVDQVILKAISLLKAQGKIVIFVHSETGADFELFLRAMENMEYLSRPLADENVTRKYICEILAKNAICFTTKEAPSEIDVTQFIKRQNTATANDVVSFFIQTKFEKLPHELREGLYEMVKNGVRHSADDQYMFSHPTAMILIEQK